ncbi:sialate O-acetylesterase [Sphingobacterium thalpophilum]|uniref:sialate O-acetylesterase n=1 Tax=Sphingobacterium thalpophilum TaxID=259 RepID=UPI002D7810F0|nr:sialate O-acetylesterase [Sphingobacterium thalpophilum]
MNKVILYIVLFILASRLEAAVVLPNIFAHHMVLQRDRHVPIFGTASGGESIVVNFQNQRIHTRADKNGNWQVVLKPMKANAVGQTLTIIGSTTIELKDVVVGEVWLCSGQSNMEYQMRKIAKEKPPLRGNYFPLEEVKEAKNADLRIFLVRRKFLLKPSGKYEGWALAQDSALAQFSAPAYFFGKKLQEELKVPVGIIASAVSGSRIEPWFAEAYWNSSPYLKEKPMSGDPGKFYHLMIEPLAPYALRGFIWYQGESNVFMQENLSYSYKMKALIENWRNLWKDPKMPFYFTQIAPFRYSLDEKRQLRMPTTVLPEFREAQDLVLQLPFTGRIITTDLVDDIDNLHPNYKWEIGRRHALKALKNVYKKKIIADGPEIKSVKIKGQKAYLTFKHAKGLKSLDGRPLNSFEVAGDDAVFFPAMATIINDTIILQHAGLPRIVQVRFAWDEAAQPNLVNAAGLPAAPFRTDGPLKSTKL